MGMLSVLWCRAGDNFFAIIIFDFITDLSTRLLHTPAPGDPFLIIMSYYFGGCRDVC